MATPSAPPVRVAVRLAAPTAELEALAEPLLAPEERVRRDRFLHDGARREYLVGRWLLRTTLAAELGADAASLRFVENAHGALSLPAPATLSFNLSHTKGLVAVATCDGHDVGVDVEDRLRRGRTTEIAHRFFAPAEVAALRALPEEAQRDRFFAIWTLKEAYIKARGLGLALPLATFAFDLDTDPGAVGLSLTPAARDDATRWRFERRDPTPRHRLAIAAATGSSPIDLDVVWCAGR
ncbi:MAG: 4'-phosphopantetheinyl transferase superfamily protein [Myxococcales bacterium]|nr:4'-phosphopantetheinyl transferase superfamily protein [Myxococcales bacterium]